MAISFPKLPAWLWRNPSPQPPSSPPDSAPSLDLDTHILPYHPHRNDSFHPAPPTLSASFHSGVKPHDRRRRWHKSRSQTPSLDLDFDMVLIPPDGGCCLSGSESEDSDWSVGWFESHAPGFCSDSEPENSFAVLVRCYGLPTPDALGGWGRAQEENSKSQLLSGILSNIAMNSQAEGKKCLQQSWSSLQG